MIYDFDTPVDRADIGSEKWDVQPGELPMWVADMDFATAPCIMAAVQARAARPSFGYNGLSDEWSQAVASWWGRRHDWTFDRTAMSFCTGVIPALASLVRSLTPPGGKVLVQNPVYNHFYSSIGNSGREVLSSDLVYDGERYTIDFTDLAAKMARPDVDLMILCNPHNPIGRIWTRPELARVGELAVAHGVVVVSDEIHCDITRPGTSYVPFAVASPGCPAAICISPTKAFSIPGLQSSVVVVPDAALRQTVFAGLDRDEINFPNAFAEAATVAAFNEGEAWIDEMRAYVEANMDLAFAAIDALGLRAVRGDATYLLWVDCASLVGEDGDTETFCGYLRQTTGLWVSAGAAYRGPRFIRINLGCPRSLVEDGLARLARGVSAWRARLGG